MCAHYNHIFSTHTQSNTIVQYHRILCWSETHLPHVYYIDNTFVLLMLYAGFQYINIKFLSIYNLVKICCIWSHIFHWIRSQIRAEMKWQKYQIFTRFCADYVHDPADYDIWISAMNSPQQLMSANDTVWRTGLVQLTVEPYFGKIWEPLGRIWKHMEQKYNGHRNITQVSYIMTETPRVFCIRHQYYLAV